MSTDSQGQPFQPTSEQLAAVAKAMDTFCSVRATPQGRYVGYLTDAAPVTFPATHLLDLNPNDFPDIAVARHSPDEFEAVWPVIHQAASRVDRERVEDVVLGLGNDEVLIIESMSERVLVASQSSWLADCLINRPHRGILVTPWGCTAYASGERARATTLQGVEDVLRLRELAGRVFA